MLTKVGCAPTYQEKIIIFPSQPTLLNSEVPEMPWWNTIGHLKEDLPSRWPQSLQRGIFPAFCWWKNSRPQRIATPLQFDHPWLLIFPPLSKKPGKMGLSLRTFPPKVFSDNCFIDITGKDMTWFLGDGFLVYHPMHELLWGPKDHCFSEHVNCFEQKNHKSTLQDKDIQFQFLRLYQVASHCPKVTHPTKKNNASHFFWAKMARDNARGQNAINRTNHCLRTCPRKTGWWIWGGCRLPLDVFLCFEPCEGTLIRWFIPPRSSLATAVIRNHPSHPLVGLTGCIGQVIRQSAIQTSCRLFGVVLASGPKTKRSLRSFF